jgi:hypothetical protein
VGCTDCCESQLVLLLLAITVCVLYVCGVAVYLAPLRPKPKQKGACTPAIEATDTGMENIPSPTIRPEATAGARSSAVTRSLCSHSHLQGEKEEGGEQSLRYLA